MRRRTAALVAFAAAPAGVGLALVAPALTVWLYGQAYAPTAAPLAVLSLGVVPLFLNALYTHALIAAERASWLPRLTVVRVLLAALLAALLVPVAGASGAAAGFVLSQLVLLLLGARAAARAGFAVAVARPIVLALLATVPMALAVLPLPQPASPGGGGRSGGLRLDPGRGRRRPAAFASRPGLLLRA